MGVPPSPTTATGCRGFYGIASPPASFRNDAADWTGTWLVDGAGHWVQQGATPALFLLSNEAPELARILVPASVPDAPPEYEDHTRDVHYVPAPCQVACPIGTDAPSCIACIRDEDYEGAFEAITSTNPFSSICGRVCDVPCEPACRRVDSDGAVQIRNLKRFVMDKLGATWRPPAAPVTRSRSIGIVGAGPAGLVAAHDLCVAGYSVHVYEMTDRLGGMMIWGIPAFRLPPGINDEDVDRLMQRCPGIEVHLDTALGRDVSLEELKERHDAVVLTIGAWWGKPMGIAGEEDERVVDGVGFLRRVNAGERLDLDIPFFVAGFDAASEELKVAVDRGVVAAGAADLGGGPGPNAPWCEPGRDAPSHDAAGVVYRVGERWHPMPTARVPSRFSACSSPHAVIWRTRSSTRSSAASTCWCSTARALSAVSGRSSAPSPTSLSSTRPSRPCDA